MSNQQAQIPPTPTILVGTPAQTEAQAQAHAEAEIQERDMTPNVVLDGKQGESVMAKATSAPAQNAATQNAAAASARVQDVVGGDLVAQIRKDVERLSIDEAFKQAEAAQARLQYLTGFVNKDSGLVDCQAAATAEGRSDSEIYEEVQKLSALITQAMEINARKQEHNAYFDAANAPLAGSQRGIAPSANGGMRMANNNDGLFEHLERTYGLPKEIDFFEKKNYRITNLHLDEMLNVTQRPTGSWARTGTHQGGIRPDRFRNTEEIVMAVPYRNFFSPMIPRMACPSNTDSFVWLQEPEIGIGGNGATGMFKASGAYNSPAGSNYPHAVAGVAENAAFPAQDIAIEEKMVTMVKRAVFATITSEQANDVSVAKAYLNQILLRLVAEDLENMLLNGDGSGQNLRGLLNTSGLLTYDRPTKVVNSANVAQNNLLLDYLKAAGNFWKRRGVGAGKAPSHLVMPYPEKTRAMEVTDTQNRFMWSNAVTGDFSAMWGIPIVLSDYMPAETAMYINVGDVALVVKSGVDVQFGLNGEDFRNDRASVRIKHRCQTLVKHAKSILKMTDLAGDTTD